jgi:hypothetical protein
MSVSVAASSRPSADEPQERWRRNAHARALAIAEANAIEATVANPAAHGAERNAELVGDLTRG